MRSSRQKLARVLVTAASVALTTVIAMLAMLFSPGQVTSAQAVIPIGPGYQIPNPFRDSIIGGYIADDGSVLYCLEWGKESPTGASDPVLSVESTAVYDNWSHLEVARVNYLISKWGQTADNDEAAAVAMAIWMRHPGDSDPFFPEHRFVKATITDSNKRAIITHRAQAMNAEANTFVPKVRAAIGELIITPDSEHAMSGVITVSGVPEEASGTLQVEGATLEITDSSSVAGITDGASFRYVAEPSDEDLGSLTVSAQVVFVTPGTPGDELVVWRTPDSFQNLGQASSWVPDFQFALDASHEIDLSFLPVLSTQAAQQRVLAGQPLVDTVMFSLAEGSREWRRLSDDTFVEVEAWCQAYGPLEEHPELTPKPPAEAPLFGERIGFSVGGSLENPLETVYEAEFESLPSESGHYTFVCGIDQQRQTADAASSSLPMGYAFQHEYGLAEETVVVSAPLAKTGSQHQIQAVALTAAVALLFGALMWVASRMRQRSQ
jgi:hypothetical protein